MSQSPDKNAIRKDSYSNCFEGVVEEDLSINVNDDDESSNSEKPEVIIISESVLNNINGCGLCKLKTKGVSVENVPDATSASIVDKIENQQSIVILPEWLVVDVGMNNLLNDMNLLNNIKKIFTKAKQKSTNNKLACTSIIFGNNIRNIENTLRDTNATVPQNMLGKK